MNDKSIYFIATLMGGAVLPVQVALNALLRRYVGQPMQVTFISYLAGTLASLAICWFARYPLPATAVISQTSWWMWIGGCLGTLYVWSTIFAAAKIGTALTLALTIAGQMICALFLDHYGVIGLTKVSANPLRIAGVVLVIIGVSFVAYAKK
ncbi:DMT family transporter (plasmid) [Phormidium sp. CLA17]|uniref:DMT family transporter n=1 Tax=Leptolyngbya sp. Cla-17 TaxID=2803751 RepID=UPI0014912B2D|nr:DMT family transporter [Leptolyngbya sp. Cla-17]MBM0745176.1 DMT family transporter [Leptolyngbya sp. Cla-17]